MLQQRARRPLVAVSSPWWKHELLGSELVFEHALTELARRLTPSPRITILTGAGISKASGIPTFRGTDGLWHHHRPEQLATPGAFASDPQLVWEWYAWRRQRVAACLPNRAHEVLAAWSHRFDQFLLITQNVDGLHERAGTREVLRFHNSIWELQCWQLCADAPGRWSDEKVPFPEMPPRCPYCGGLVRPRVVWFGESIDPAVFDRSLAATACDIFLTVGTSAIVHPAASLIAQALGQGAYTVEINLEATPASKSVDLAIHGPAEDLLGRLEDILLTGSDRERQKPGA